MSKELKPCPFCGGTDLSSEHWVVMPDDYHAARVVCADCELEGPSSLTLPEPDGCWTGDEASAIELGVKAWNRRAQAAPEAKPVAAQHRFRNPQKTETDWTIWQGTTVNKDRPSWEIDSKGYEVEYRLLYAAPQHDTEMIELLREARGSLENNVGMQDGYIDYGRVHALKIRIDAKLATLKVKP